MTLFKKKRNPFDYIMVYYYCTCTKEYVFTLTGFISSSFIRVMLSEHLFFSADHVYGDQEMHSEVRRRCMDYMVSTTYYYLTHWLLCNFSVFKQINANQDMVGLKTEKKYSLPFVYFWQAKQILTCHLFFLVCHILISLLLIKIIVFF